MTEIKEEEEKKKKKTRALKRCGGEESSTGEKRRKNIKEEKKNTTSLVLKTESKRCGYDLTSNHFFPARFAFIGQPCTDYKDRPKPFRDETYLEETQPLEIEKGKPLPIDVCSLLSNGGKFNYLVRNNGERVLLSEAITGKYLIICCFSVPILSKDPAAYECRALINTYNELKKEKKDDFEMVIVAKMRCSFMAEDEEEPAFNRFFSEFPCLAVPFEEESSRNMICKLLGLGTEYNLASVCLILDPCQEVLQEDVEHIRDHGAACYPFTDDQVISLDDKSRELRMRLDPAYRYYHGDPDNPLLSKPLTLEELFCCDSSMPLGQCVGDKKISVSQLSKSKCVALYVCYDGEFMSTLESIRKKFVERECELQIVIIYQPGSLEESSYFEDVKSALEKNNISSWWVLPFRDQVCRRVANIGWAAEENVIIWANGGLDGEMDGLEFMKACGDHYYPPTKNSYVKARISALMSFSLESFLGDRLRFKGEYLNVANLRNKDILLYLESSRSVLLYEQIKNKCPDSEVVCLPYNPKRDFEIPIPYLSDPVARPKGMTNATLVAFGKDNKIKSLYANRRLGSRVEEGVSLFEDTLLDEIHEEVFELLC